MAGDYLQIYHNLAVALALLLMRTLVVFFLTPQARLLCEHFYTGMWVCSSRAYTQERHSWIQEYAHLQFYHDDAKLFSNAVVSIYTSINSHFRAPVAPHSY